MRKNVSALHRRRWWSVAAVSILLAAHVALAADLPDSAFRDRIGAELYDKVTGVSGGKLTDAQKQALETFVKHKSTFEAYRADDPASYAAATKAIGELYGEGDRPSRLAEVRWLLQVEVIQSALSERMADIRNRMVFEICQDMARKLGEVHRMDFSPAVNLLNDIDHTFKSPEMLKALGIDGQKLVSEFNDLYRTRFGINPHHMDVVSHPSEANIPDWRSRVDVHEFVATLRQGSKLLSDNPEAYFLEGAFRMQVERRSYQSDKELYSIFAANPHETDGPVARIAVTKGKIRDIKYKLILPPEMNRNYAWGSSVGNWHFYRQHAIEEPGAAARYAAKYGLRSFAEGPGWLVMYDNRISPDIAPAEYENMVDATAREGLVRQVYEKYYKNSGLTADEVWWTIEKAKAIRNMKDAYNQEAAFSAEARKLAPGSGDAQRQAYEKNKQALILEVDGRFQANMSRLMVENMKASLPGRLADWLSPKVSAYRLGFTARDIKKDAAGVRAAVETARKRLRTVALFEVLHGLRTLDPKQRAEVINHAIDDLKQRRAGERFTFERTIRAIAKLANMKAKPHLLQTDQEAGRNKNKKRQAVGDEAGKLLLVATVDPLDEAEQHQRKVSEEIQMTLSELKESVQTEVLSNLDSEGEVNPKSRLHVAAGEVKSYFVSQWDQSLSEAGKSLEGGVTFILSNNYRRAAVNQARMQMLDAFGYEFRKDWKALEGIDLGRDTSGFNGRHMVRSAMNWNNADSLLNIIRTYRETNGDAEKVREQVLMEAANRLPMVGDAMQLQSILAGETHPGMLGVMAGSFFFPAVGQVMFVYGIGSNIYFILTDVQFDSQTQLHLQGIIPYADRTEGPGTGYGKQGLKGMLQPVYEAMMKHREKLKQLAREDPELKVEIENLLQKVYTPDFNGTKAYVYAYYNPMIEEKFKQDLTRWPREQWDVLRLSSHQAPIRSNDPSEDFNPNNQSPMLRAFFRKWVNQYMQGEGPFKDITGHAAAHQHPFLNEQYFFKGEPKQSDYDKTVESMTSVLVAAYTGALVRTEKGEPIGTLFDYKWGESAPVGIDAYLYGAKGSNLAAYDIRYENDPNVPNLPSFLDVTQPGGTLAQKRQAFFKYFDDILNEKLQARNQKYHDSPKEKWTQIKLGKKHANLRPIAAEEAAVAHPLLLAFFNRQVKLYADKLHPQIDAGRLKKEQTTPSGQGDFITEHVDAPKISSEVQKRIVQQLIREFRAGLISSKNNRQKELDRRLLERALPNAMAMGWINTALWGADRPVPGERMSKDTNARLMASMARMLAHHSGDPFVNDEMVKKAVNPLVNTPSDLKIEIVGELPAQMKPNDSIKLSCRISATSDFIRPFRVNWAINRAASTASLNAEPTDKTNSNLMVTRLLVSDDKAAIKSGDYMVTAYVTDATGREVGTKTRTFKLGELLKTPAREEEPQQLSSGTSLKMLVREREAVEGGTGIMRNAGVVRMVWKEPTRQWANFKSNAGPHVWISWDQKPEKKFYAFLGRLKGGSPETDAEIAVAFQSSLGSMFQVRKVSGSQFIFPLPAFAAGEHVGKYQVTGKLMAFDPELRPRGRDERWKTAKPDASKDVSLNFEYFPLPPKVTRSRISLTGSHQLTGGGTIEDIQPGRRVIRISVGGHTRYAMMPKSRGIFNFRINGQTSIVSTAQISFMNFGEMVTVDVKFEKVQPRDLNKIDQERIERIKQGIAEDIEKNLDDVDVDVADRYRSLSQYYCFSTTVMVPDQWHAAYSEFLRRREYVVQQLANPNWKAYKADSQLRDFKFEDEYFSRMKDSGKKARAAKAIQSFWREILIEDYLTGAARAAACDMLDVADSYTKRANAHVDSLQADDKRIGEIVGRVARGYGVLSSWTFKLTGDLKKAKSYHDMQQELRAREYQLRGRTFTPGKFSLVVDPEFQTSGGAGN